MEIHDLLALIVVGIGLGGIILPVLPGMLLQLVAVTFWAFEESSPLGWVTLVVVAVVAVAASVLKYLHPGRRLKKAGISNWLLVAAVAAGLVGLFVIPVIGGPIAFVTVIYMSERARHGRARAKPSTKTALGALAQSFGIELAGGSVILLVLLAAVIVG